MAELHVIGELVGGRDFPNQNLFCKWEAVQGPAWERLAGEASGQTQVDHPLDGTFAKWAHPIDLFFSSKGIQGWPKLVVQVWSHDIYGRNDLVGYGFCHVPTQPGSHQIECHVWRPLGTGMQQLKSMLVGGGPHLTAPEIVFAPDDRYRLRTQAMGVVLFELGVIARNFEKFGVQL
eukprot:m.58616 g.58616  ORF g.58616 m.58616 type:complete len:176 (+) comp11189_c0_seq3:244-771(+)